MVIRCAEVGQWNDGKVHDDPLASVLLGTGELQRQPTGLYVHPDPVACDLITGVICLSCDGQVREGPCIDRDRSRAYPWLQLLQVLKMLQMVAVAFQLFLFLFSMACPCSET